MKIKDCYRKGKPVVSFEVFPPKKDADITTITGVLAELAALKPDFISVTYGAGGGGAVNRTGQIAASIKRDLGVESLAHLTCITATKSRIRELAAELRESGVENILAMRGDLPADGSAALSADYRYAHQLIADLKAQGGFCIGAACYPEGHIDCADMEESLAHLRQKQEAGADFAVSQLFFENGLYFRFQEAAAKAGITIPLSAGVMPILSRGQVERMIFMCGASLPSAIIKLLHQYEHSPEDLRRAGTEYAVRQMEGLAAGGAQGVHIYTMNRPSIAVSAMERLRG